MAQELPWITAIHGEVHQLPQPGDALFAGDGQGLFQARQIRAVAEGLQQVL